MVDVTMDGAFYHDLLRDKVFRAAEKYFGKYTPQSQVPREGERKNRITKQEDGAGGHTCTSGDARIRYVDRGDERAPRRARRAPRRSGRAVCDGDGAPHGAHSSSSTHPAVCSTRLAERHVPLESQTSPRHVLCAHCGRLLRPLQHGADLQELEPL